jgi:hypothetical protein
MAYRTEGTPDLGAVINGVLEGMPLSAAERQSIATALIDRVQANLRQHPDKAIDLREFERGVRTIARQATATGQETVPPSELSTAQASVFINGLCDRYDLPWPICPIK